MKFAECMRDNGVSGVPGPGRVGRADHRRDRERLVAGPEHPGVEAGHRRVQGPAAAGVHGPRAERPSSRRRRLEFAQCIRDNGVKDFPDPAPDAPLVDTNRIPSAATSGGMTVLNAAMQTCGDPSRRAGREGPVRRKTWALAAAAVLVAATATGGVVAMSGARAGDPGRAGAAGEHREGGAGEALGHGLPGRDPDLPGAIGRLAVRRDQPGPRDLHRAARRTATRSAAATCSIGWTTSRCCCCAARSRPTATCTGATRARTSVSSTGTCTSSATTPVPARSRRTVHREDGEGARGAPARQGRSTRPERSPSATRSSCPRPVRIAKVTGELGGSARPGAPVVHATSDTLEVQVDLDASQQGEVEKGDRAQITLPGNTSVTGRVDRLGRVAQAPAGPDSDARRDATIPAYISLDDPDRRAGSTGPRSRWTSRPRAWRAP